MITYRALAKQPSRLQAMTTLRPAEFKALLPHFVAAWAATVSAEKTQAGQPRRRRPGGGRKARLARLEDKLLFVLIYDKTYLLQTAHGLLFGLSQSQTNDWLHRLQPVLASALERAGYAPAREQPAATPQALQLDGTERPRQRPQDPAKWRTHYSGKKKRHTDKNVLLVAEATQQVAYLGATQPGHMHDKQAVDTAQLHFAPGTQVTCDSGFQGFAPANAHMIQLKKAMRGHPLSTLDRIANRLKARARILIEHVLASVKRCRIIKDVLRNTKTGFSDLVMYSACGLHNLRTACRFLRSPAYLFQRYFR